MWMPVAKPGKIHGILKAKDPAIVREMLWRGYVYSDISVAVGLFRHTLNKKIISFRNHSFPGRVSMRVLPRVILQSRVQAAIRRRAGRCPHVSPFFSYQIAAFCRRGLISLCAALQMSVVDISAFGTSALKVFERPLWVVLGLLLATFQLISIFGSVGRFGA
jgi:hypothetical protein